MSAECEMVRMLAILGTGLGLGVLVGWHLRDWKAREEVIDLERRYAKDLGRMRKEARR